VGLRTFGFGKRNRSSLAFCDNVPPASWLFGLRKVGKKGCRDYIVSLNKDTAKAMQRMPDSIRSQFAMHTKCYDLLPCVPFYMSKIRPPISTVLHALNFPSPLSPHTHFPKNARSPHLPR
jgi:hypothetical protein